MYTLIKSLQADFPNGLTHHHLIREIIDAGVTTCKDVYQSGDVVTIAFSADYTASLSVINSVIAGYVAVPAFFDELRFKTITAADSPHSVIGSVKCDTSAGNITLQLPRVARAKEGIFAAQKIASTGVVTILPYGAELIEGAGSVTLTALKSFVALRSDGTNWTRTGDRARVVATMPIGVVGSILVDDGSGISHLNVGADGSYLRADSTQPLGLRWATGAGGGNPECTEVFATAATTTTSAQYVAVSGMSVSPAAGNYLVMFSATGSTSSASAQVYIAIYVGGVLVVGSERLYRGATSATGSLYTQAKVTVSSGQAIEVRYKTSSGTFTMNARNIQVVSVA